MVPDEPHSLPLGQVAPNLADQHHHLLQGNCPAVVIIKHGESLKIFLKEVITKTNRVIVSIRGHKVAIITNADGPLDFDKKELNIVDENKKDL